jgi:hypothetical protein
MKKIAGVFAFLILTLISLVSAGPVEGVRQLLDGLRSIIYLVMRFLFDISGDLGIYDEYIFARIILLIIIFIIVYTVLKESLFQSYANDKGKPVLYIISAAISILSIRYLPDNLIGAILLPYSALGAALTVFLPLAIFFFFLHKSNFGHFARRFGWVIFGASFIALWWTRGEYSEIADYIYWAGLGFIIISFIFDYTIHEYMGLSEINKSKRMHYASLYAEYNETFKTLDGRLKDETLPRRVRDSLEQRKKIIEQKMIKLHRKL